MSNAVLIIVVLMIGGFGLMYYMNQQQPQQVVPTTTQPVTPYETGCNLPSAPSVTLKTTDVYGGAAVTSQNAYREVGTTAWTDVAGAATFNANPGDQIEIVLGVDSDDDDDEPYGARFVYTVPCQSYPIIDEKMVDDSLDTDLVVRAWDPEDGTVISSSATIDIDNGDVFNIEVEWQAVYETDYGNRYCDKGNLLCIEYNTSAFTKWYATDLNGNAYPTAPMPTLHTLNNSANTAKCFIVPTLKSNGMWNFYAVADASGSGKEPRGSAAGQENPQLALYDVNWFFNNDKTGAPVECGWEDEDGGDIGSAGADTAIIDLESD
jgi:hypothetical protein